MLLDQIRTANTAARPAASDAVEMRYATPRLRRAATLLFAHEAQAEATSEALAAASARLLDRLSHRLAQVIGPVGVQAIFLRAIKLREPEFAFLGERIIAGERGDSIIEPLLACLREQEPDVIQEVSVILFATCAGLLATVIGERLAWSLLQQIWPDIPLTKTEILGSDHSKDLRLYEVHSQGLTIGERVNLYDHGLLTANLTPTSGPDRSPGRSRGSRRLDT